MGKAHGRYRRWRSWSTAPASEDSVQLGGVKRPRVLTVRVARERTETSGAIKEPRPWQAATRLADGERGDERAIPRRVLLYQALKGFRHPMDGMGWQYPKSVCQLLVGNRDSVGLRSIISLGGWQIVFDSWRPGSCVRPGLLCR
jgi:hypothetical protein